MDRSRHTRLAKVIAMPGGPSGPGPWNHAPKKPSAPKPPKAEPVVYDDAAITALPSLATMVKTGQKQDREWATRVHIIAQEGKNILVFTTWAGAAPMVIKSIEHVSVSGYPGFKLRFAVPASSWYTSHDKYSTGFVGSRGSSAETAVTRPSPGRAASNLLKIQKDFPTLFEKLKPYIKSGLPADPSPGPSPEGATTPGA